VCRREIFDNVLVRAARREVDVLEGWGVRGVTRHNGAVTGVRVQGENGEEHDISARVVIGADGYNSAVAKSLGLYRHDSRRWWVGTRAYYRSLDVAPQTVEVHYVDDTLPGFLWLFPTGDGVVNVGLGVIHRDLKRRGHSIRSVHEAVVNSDRFRERFGAAERVGGISGWHLPTPDMSRTVAGDGFLLIGDAAGLVDPFSGEGIGNAMCSGEVASRVVADALRPGAIDDTALSRYPAMLWDALDRRELTQHYRLRSLARRRWLLNLIVGRAAAHSDVLEWISAMTGEHGAVERKKALMSPLTYLRLLFMGK
jgi:flavin-dependent dehydrogenase